jgi:hypothetical protein
LTFLEVYLVVIVAAVMAYMAWVDEAMLDGFSGSGLCPWGCGPEYDLFVGMLVAAVPYPIVVTLKLLFGKAEVLADSDHDWRTLSSTGYLLRTITGICLVTALHLFIAVFAGTLVSTMPMNQDQAERFIVILSGALAWSLVIGEVLVACISALLTWLAVSSEYNTDGRMLGSAKTMLQCCPCLLLTKL